MPSMPVRLKRHAFLLVIVCVGIGLTVCYVVITMSRDTKFSIWYGHSDSLTDQTINNLIKEIDNLTMAIIRTEEQAAGLNKDLEELNRSAKEFLARQQEIVLFTVGTIITIFALDDGTASLFSSLGHMWLVGPIFISSGLMVAVKTVLYLRKKNLMTFLVRQRTMLRDIREGHSIAVARNPSTITLPPSYDSAVCQLMSDSRESDAVRCIGFRSEAPPPSYEEAMILVEVQQRERMLSSAIEEYDRNRQHITKDSAA